MAIDAQVSHVATGFLVPRHIIQNWSQSCSCFKKNIDVKSGILKLGHTKVAWAYRKVAFYSHFTLLSCLQRHLCWYKYLLESSKYQELFFLFGIGEFLSNSIFSTSGCYCCWEKHAQGNPVLRSFFQFLFIRLLWVEWYRVLLYYNWLSICYYNLGSTKFVVSGRSVKTSLNGLLSVELDWSTVRT